MKNEKNYMGIVPKIWQIPWNISSSINILFLRRAPIVVQNPIKVPKIENLSLGDLLKCKCLKLKLKCIELEANLFIFVSALCISCKFNLAMA